MRGGRLARAAKAHGLGGWQAAHYYGGTASFVVAGYLVFLTGIFALAGGRSAWGLTAAVGALAVLGIGSGVQTRRRKAVHLFEGGVVLTGMWGQVKAVGRWPELTVYAKRTAQFSGSRNGYAVAIGGRERFGFGRKQVTRGPELVEAMTASAAAGHRRALEEAGSITFGAESGGSDPLGPLRVTPERIHLEQHGVEIAITDIKRVWIAFVPFRGQDIRILNVTTAAEPVATTMLSSRPADIEAAGDLIASLAGKKVELGEGVG
ncbi:hypothetical protein GCM10009839_91870 [Catenulispora yoronensis]|uniref:DUF3137 domain-containing protein n=1 Tax=Catenulispora yoronensis TaxID=450799 RepID=A0ABP5H978_9ACTN